MRPVLSAAGLPLQAGALVAASARILHRSPTTFAAVSGFQRTSPQMTRRALMSGESADQKQDVQEEEEDRTLAEHGSKVIVRFPPKNKIK